MSHRPNILLILTDQQRPDTLGCYGNVFTKTPNVDRLAKEGALFEKAFTLFPLCTPARAALWSGVYPHATGVTDVVSGVDDAFAWGRYRQSLFAPMKAAGYFQAYVGKWHLGDAKPDGVDVWNVFNSGGGQWVDGYQSFQGGAYIADKQTDDMIDVIATRSPEDGPFLLVQSYYPPHEPYTAPAKYMNLYRGKGVFRPGYYAAVTALDDCVGRLIEALRAGGHLDDTLILFVSDHGEHFNYRGQHNKSTGHDESLQIPLVAWWPKAIRGGQSFNQMVGVHDILPTLLDAAGVDAPKHLHGRSLWPMMTGQAAFDRDRLYFQNVQDFRTIDDWVRLFDAGPYLPNTRERFSPDKEWDRQRALRTRTEKLVLSEHGDHLMYDLIDDPEEEIDIYGAPKPDYQNQTLRMKDQTPRMIRLISELREEANAIDDAFGRELADRALAGITPPQP